MIAITVDDERPMLEQLSQAVKVSPDVSSVLEFTTCTEALEWVEKNHVDIAFLDISMRGMGGMALSEKLLKLRPQCKIIFCTGYSEYAVDVEQLDCDYLKYLRTGKPEFCGEYMSQYSWAEETCALLFRKGSK